MVSTRTSDAFISPPILKTGAGEVSFNWFDFLFTSARQLQLNLHVTSGSNECSRVHSGTSDAAYLEAGGANVPGMRPLRARDTSCFRRRTKLRGNCFYRRTA